LIKPAAAVTGRYSLVVSKNDELSLIGQVAGVLRDVNLLKSKGFIKSHLAWDEKLQSIALVQRLENAIWLVSRSVE